MSSGYRPQVGWKYALAGLGVTVATAAAVTDPGRAGAAAGQVWPAFVLVAGLLLVGMVAADDGLFAWLGGRLGGLGGGSVPLLVAVTATVAVVTAVLNLDTSVAFLGPILVHTARRRSLPPARLLALCLLVSNAGSLLLPGSNLTNLIVVGERTSGTAMAARTFLPWLAAVVVTAAIAVVVVGRGGGEEAGHAGGAQADVAGGRGPAAAGAAGEQPAARRRPAGAIAVAAVVAAVLVLPDPAPAVAVVGAVVAAWRVGRGRIEAARIWRTVDVAVLVGLFGLAVGLGTLGRAWSGPAQLLAHLDPWATAGLGALASVLVNNLPAAAVLSARPPAHPLSLLVGLDIGPNLFVTGSLAWVLWYGAARAAGAAPDLRRTVRAGLVSAPLAGAAAVGILLLAGSHA